MCAGTGEMFAEEGEAMLDLKEVAKSAISPLSHRHASRISATLPAMVCSSSRAWALRASSFSFSVSRCATACRGARLFELRPALRKARFGEAEKDQPENGRRVLPRFQPGIRPELVGGIPEALLKRVVGGVFLGWRDPAHLPASPERALSGRAGAHARLGFRPSRALRHAQVVFGLQPHPDFR